MEGNKKIALNSAIIFVRLIISTIVGVYSSRIVIDALGASDYGLYNVVGGIVSMLNVVNAAMLSTTYRYLAFEIGKKEEGYPNKVFNISLYIHFFFAVTLIVFGLVLGLWYIDNYLNVEVGRICDAKFVFIVSLFTTSFSTLFIPYQGLQVAYEKFAVNAIIDIVSILLRLGALLLFVYYGNRIRTYSLIMMGHTVVASLMYYAYCNKNYREVIKLRFYRDYILIKQMLNYAFWTMIGALANIGKNQGSAILINFFYGTIVNAAFAIGNQVEGFILMFSRSLNSAAIPQITKNYSGGNQSRSTTLACYISKYTFFLMAMVAFPVLLEMDFLLGLWLKDIPAGTTVFCKLIVLGGLLDCLGAGIPALVNATGRIRNYQVVVQTFLLLGLPISFVLFKLGFNEYTISVVYCIIIFLSAFIKLFLLKRIYSFDVKSFIKISYIRILVVSIPLVIAYLLYDSTDMTLLGHILGLVLSEFFVLVCIVLLGLEKREKKIALGYVTGAISLIKK